MAEQEQQQAQNPQAPPKKKSKLWLILPMAFLILGISALMGLYFGGAFSSADDTPEKPPEKVNKTVELQPILIQLADKTRKQRFVRLKLTLGLYRPEDRDLPEIEKEPSFEPKLQDRLIFAIGSKTSDEITRPGGRAQLKDELFTQVRDVFPEKYGKVLEIYITELLIQ